MSSDQDRRRHQLAGIAAGLVLVAAGPAAAKTLIDYFQPTPIVCPLTSNTWGAAGVLPRDTCNGLEDATDSQWQYWDGKILQGPDGKPHMYAGRWPQNKGFADWPQSVIVEAVSNGTYIGSYIPSANSPFTGKEQNVTGIDLVGGGYALLDSPGHVYTSQTLVDPWTAAGTLTIDANGSKTSTATTENQSIWQSLDGTFLIISRTFQEMTSPKNILGPYTIEATIPSLQSQGYEDPVVWCSGGQYHLVANMYNARKAMHFTSADGIHNWLNQGLAYDPTTDFIRYTDGTVNHWYKAERPGVFMQGGHVVAFTFAVIDVDKTLDLANDKHGSKIVVVPFDGVSFDRDNPGPGSASCPLEAAGGSSGSGGSAGGSGGGSAVAGAGGQGGSATSRGHGGTAGDGGVGSDASGGEAVVTGGSGAAGEIGAGGPPIVGVGAGGHPAQGGGRGGTVASSIAGAGVGGASGIDDASSGCSCMAATGAGGSATGWWVLVMLAGVVIRRRRVR
jgi:MYXO-CTERM domain-containing protein